jgi:hypothetical protein
VFKHVIVISRQAALDGKQTANFVVVASDEPLAVAEIATRVATVPDPGAVADGREWAKHARVLTDDRSPVDQLLSR